MKTIKTYEAFDGQIFESREACEAHERSLKPAGRRSRTLDALPEGLAAHALADLNSDLAKQLVTLGSQIRDARAKAGLTKPRARNAA